MANTNSSSKYYRSPGSLPRPDASLPCNPSSSYASPNDSTVASKYYRTEKRASSLALPEIFKAIPPGMSKEDAVNWSKNMWERAKDAGVDVEILNNHIQLQTLQNHTQAVATVSGINKSRQSSMATHFTRRTPELAQAQAPSVPSFPFTYSTPDEMRDDANSSVSDEALTRLLIQFFQEWNSINPESGTYGFDRLAKINQSSRSHSQHGETISASSLTPKEWTPFAYRTPEELAELKRTKVVPGSRYR